MTHAQTWRTEREESKEVPRGSISPASEHINRSQPYYSQSKGEKKYPLEKRGESSKEKGTKSPESGHYT